MVAFTTVVEVAALVMGDSYFLLEFCLHNINVIWIKLRWREKNLERKKKSGKKVVESCTVKSKVLLS